MITQLAENIWIVDGPEVSFVGATVQTRMTIVRLDDGDLWVHSPVELNNSVQLILDDLGGDVAALVAPNKYHHLFIKQWILAYPKARVFAEAAVRKKIPALASAEQLTNTAPRLYAAEIDQVVFAGNLMYEEVVFFHKKSCTLILTDLMVNLKTDNVKLLPRLFILLDDVSHPNGGVSRLFRWLTLNRRPARKALHTILGWSPRRITFCHGELFAEEADVVLRREFRWLLR